jgi:Protein of unknown function (DUF3540)
MRGNTALRREATTAMQETGRVTATLGASFRVAVGSGEHDARRAVSCLVEPELGDHVLVAFHGAGCHVLAVLDRESEGPTRLVAPGDLEISAPAGRLSFSASEAVSVVSSGEVSVASERLRASAADASFAFKALSYVGGRLVAHVDAVRTVARSLETVAERCVERLGRSYRFIEETEQVRARYLSYEAESCVQLRGHAAIVSSGELTKIDGAQIHVG